METRSAKRRRILEPKSASGIDYISDLPNDILCIILGHLNIETIASMSLLSKRWLQIWRSLPVLDFTTVPLKNQDDLYEVYKMLQSKHEWNGFDMDSVRNFQYLSDKNFIRDALSARDNNDLHALKFRACICFTGLYKLIREALDQNVKELDIELLTESTFNVPKCLYLSKSLEVLKLKSTVGFQFPFLTRNDGFRSLQVLSLSCICMRGELNISTETFPVLRKLSILGGYGVQKVLKVNCSELKDVTLEEFRHLVNLELEVPRLEKLRIANCFSYYLGKSFVKVDCPMLRVLEWNRNCLISGCSLQNLTALHQATLVYDFNEHSKTGNHTVVLAKKLRSAWNFLRGICHLRSLKLDRNSLKFLQLLAQQNYGPLLPLIDLENLELLSDFSLILIPAIDLLFKSSPSLCSLALNKTDHLVKLSNPNVWRGETHTGRIMSIFKKLEVLKINGYVGCIGEVNLLKIFLKHGKALKEIFLRTNSSCREQIKSQLMEFSEVSSKVKISVEYE